MSTYRESYTNGNTADNKNNIKDVLKKQAGVATDPKRISRKKLGTFLIGENYRDYEDPQNSTHCQRSWVYGKETSLSKVEQKLNRTLADHGGKMKRRTAMNSLLRSMYGKGKQGDMPNSLPIEGKKFFHFEKIFFFLKNFNFFILTKN